jgi:2,5-furandicarboxylate decarboxylase 1
VEWAIATRFQAGKDLVVKLDQPVSSLDPSSKQEEGKKALTDKIGVDATIPFDVEKSKYEIVKYSKVNLDDYLR